MLTVNTLQEKVTESIKNQAKNLGIDLIGITRPLIDDDTKAHLRRFVAEKRHGDMAYLEDLETRLNPNKILPNVQSVIVIGVNYYRPQAKLPATHGRIARYAYGRDYHKVLRKLLKNLESFVKEILPHCATRICVDSAPLLEKYFAVQAGLGFIGRNTTLITKEFGSFVVLGSMLTDAVLDYDEPGSGTCGTCRRCLDACPTKALPQPYVMDARRCISYLTIEHKGEIDSDLQPLMGTHIFGCDVCQEVCPYNQAFAKPLQLEAWREVKIAGESLAFEDILAIENDELYTERFKGSPLMRAKRSGLQRNAKIGHKNHGAFAYVNNSLRNF